MQKQHHDNRRSQEDWLRERLEGLRSQKATEYTVNGRSFFQLADKEGKTRAVDTARLDGWIKNAEIELGLLLGRKAVAREEREARE